MLRYMFQELVAGGDLYSYLQFKGGSVVDAEAGIIIRQILKAVEYLHGKRIVHRDLKVAQHAANPNPVLTIAQPDNILLVSLTAGARIILTDFGHARYLPDHGKVSEPASCRMHSTVGTFEFVAP
jgi:pheromone a factor receptor